MKRAESSMHVGGFAQFNPHGVHMVSSVSSNAALSSAMLSASQCRGPRDPQAFQEKLFSKLDVDGNGSIDSSELSQFVDFASSSTSSTNAKSGSGAADLFKSM